MKIMQVLSRLVGRQPEDPDAAEAREALHAEVRERLARQEAQLRALRLQIDVQGAQVPRNRRKPS